MTRPVLRILADDLTGALDTAAEFAGLFGPVPVPLDGMALAGSAAIDARTREVSRDDCVSKLRLATAGLVGADIAFAKVDSLLRGHPMAQLAACMAAHPWRSVVLAPAFPAQGRITRVGRQYASDTAGGWRQVGAPILDRLAAEGLVGALGDAESPLSPGVTVFNATNEEEMRRIAACGLAAPGPVLWCGGGGLARALAAACPVGADTRLAGPLLAVIGSDQPVALRQAEACGPLYHRIADVADAGAVAASLARWKGAVVTFGLPPGVTRAAAAARIAALTSAIVGVAPRPGTLVVAGGETLAALSGALGVTTIEAHGLVMPGVPRSRLRGGRWDGVELVSKSGAFGGDGLWRDLLTQNGFKLEPQIA